MILENVIEIDAPPSLVWAVTCDTENWPKWTPTVDEIVRIEDGPFDVGSAARIKQPGMPEAEWRVTEFRDGERFTWETRVRGIHMAATHELVPYQSGTKNILRLEFKGLMAILLWPMIRASAKKSLEQENTGLKTQCEAARAELPD